MSQRRRIRELLFRGRIDVAALLINPELYGERGARERVLRTWTLRSRVLRLDGRYLVTLAPPVSMRTSAVLGLPFVRSEQGLVASPEIEAAPDVAACFDGGVIAEADIDVARPVDLATWFDLSDFETIEPESLGEPPPPPVRAAAPAEDVRAVLEVAEADEERAALVRALRRDVDPATRLPWWARWTQALVNAFRAFTRNDAPAEPSTTRAPAGPWQRLRNRIDRALIALTIATRLHRWFGHRQAEYLRKLVDMLDRDDDEALRHAIPLGGDANGESRPSFSVPTPRDDLRISAGGAGRGRSMFLADELYDLLRRRYRRLYERLIRQERYEEAAFVLAELLGLPEEAVQLLEKHERFVKAAELAEARRLAPGLVVRQWFLAKRYDRAVLVAKRYDAFADAVIRLERYDRDGAQALRLLWADALAEAGQFVAAVDTVWPVETARHLAQPWIAAAYAVGGPAGARMIVRALELDTEDYANLREPALAILDDDAVDGAPVREALRAALAHATSTPPLAVLARAALRSLYRDEALGTHSDATTYRALGRLSNDPVLEADRPRRAKDATTSEPIDLHIDEADAGTAVIRDLARLPDGRFLVALGEAGCVLVTRDGRITKHFDQPSDVLVPSDGGHRAIVAARRGEVWRLARFDVVRMRATFWCETNLVATAKDFDGWTWFVNAGSGLEAIDATARGFVSTWRNGSCDAQRIVRSDTSLAAATPEGSAGACVWRFELPSLTPRNRWFPRPERSVFEIDPGGFLPNCDLLRVLRVDSGGEDEQTVTRAFSLERSTPSSESRPIDLLPTTLGARVCATPSWVAVIGRHVLGCQVVVYEAAQHRRVASIALQGARDCHVRAHDSVVIIGDDRGRLIAIDVMKRRLLRSLRLTV